MSERSEFLSSRKTSAERREPEGQGVGESFLCFTLFGQAKRVNRRLGTKPQGFWTQGKATKGNPADPNPIVYPVVL